MSTSPSGTVTFLFTDIEGSTKLAQEHPDTWETLRERHHAILKPAIESQKGYVFQVIGDAFCATFHTASDALRAAVKSQLDLHHENWGDAPVKVRMGIHTGPAEIQQGGDYRGFLTMSRVQRLMSAAHGGQVLISRATQELIQDELPEGVTLRDMGERHLKDLIHPEHIYQLDIPNLPADFPPLKTLDIYRHNIPAQTTSFVGREKEMAEIKQAVNEHRLVTLTGSGGTGKTRLSLQVAADLLHQFPDGIWFLELAPLTNPDLIPQTILSVLGIGEAQGKTPMQTLIDQVHNKNLLIILDNCEHLVEACAQLVDTLLSRSPALKILASSREALGVKGEMAWHVPSLSLPDAKHLPEMNQLSQYESIRLFVERATLVHSRFHVTKENASALVQICSRLDGIPLAIELAAARVKTLSVDQIATRLNDRFRLLTGGARTALPRQQTLRALIDWSYQLLSEQEHLLFRRLAVFAGGWTLEAAESICCDGSLSGGARFGDEIQSEEILNLMEQLINKSLVVKEETQSETRYRVLETMRQYANEKLDEAGETAKVQARHLKFFLELAEQAEPHLKGAEQAKWLNRLEEEHNNLRAALEWCALRQEDTGAGLRLVGALWRFWYMRGYLSEGRERIAVLLSRADKREPTKARAKAAKGAGVLAEMQGDFDQADMLYKESLAIANGLGDREGIATSLNDLGLLAFKQGEYSLTRTLYTESLAIYQELGDRWGTALLLNNLGNLAWRQGDYVLARTVCEESLNLARKLGDKQLIRLSLLNLGLVAKDQGKYDLARSQLEESLRIARELDNKPDIAFVLNDLGSVALDEGNLDQADTLFEESLVIHRELASKQGMAEVLNNLGIAASKRGEYELARARYNKSLMIAREIGARQIILETLNSVAGLALIQGQAARGVRLMAAAEVLREELETSVEPADRARHEHEVLAARAKLSKEEFASAWEAGLKMTVEEAVELAFKMVEEM